MLVQFFSQVGQETLAFLTRTGQLTRLALGSLYHSRSLNPRQMVKQMAHLGVNSLPIVLLTIFFTGMVITVQTAQEFIKYGAQSTIGGVVAISMGRELSPVLTGVVVAGRVGAAITAEIGTMKVTEQVDALRVMAVNPVAYLVVPRLWACVVMLPVLVIFANAIGIAGSFLVTRFYEGITSVMFLNSIKTFAVPLDVAGGVIKAAFFGAIIALVGCYKGLNTAAGAEGVGKATTESVVLSIILIFAANYILSIMIYST
ncbi:MAG: ABC transporter permease [Sporomusaceae bacterium]|jgi:phospholipid/cholesterol/gamma-HCH transport system permease protein|nr:ABC transporter permease [Sporomusaceae bacterium]